MSSKGEPGGKLNWGRVLYLSSINWVVDILTTPGNNSFANSENV